MRHHRRSWANTCDAKKRIFRELLLGSSVGKKTDLKLNRERCQRNRSSMESKVVLLPGGTTRRANQDKRNPKGKKARGIDNEHAKTQ